MYTPESLADLLGKSVAATMFGPALADATVETKATPTGLTISFSAPGTSGSFEHTMTVDAVLAALAAEITTQQARAAEPPVTAFSVAAHASPADGPKKGKF